MKHHAECRNDTGLVGCIGVVINMGFGAVSQAKVDQIQAGGDTVTTPLPVKVSTLKGRIEFFTDIFAQIM
jgi:hypothetical protein